MFHIKALSTLPSLSLLIIILFVIPLTFITCSKVVRATETIISIPARAVAVATNHDKGCIIPFSSKKDWDIFWPLIFHTNGSLIQPTTTKILSQTVKNNNAFHEQSSTILISDGEEVLISCSPNYIKERPPTEYVRAICQSNGKFIIKGNGNDPIAPRDLRCDLRAIEEVLEPISDCPSLSTAVHFGYVNPVDNVSYVIGEACYNMRKGQTFFAHIYLPGRTEVKSFFQKAHPPTGYKTQLMKAFQLNDFNDRLKNILNIENIPWFEMVNYIDEDLLGNQHQYYVATKKLSWNYLILHENLMNFKLLKKDVGNLMMKKPTKTTSTITNESMWVNKEDDNSKSNNNNNPNDDNNNGNNDDENIDVYIGSHGVIKLKDSIGNKIPIYVDGIDEKFPIPEIVWIIVKKSNKATAFAILNNPLLTSDDITNNNLYCRSKCDKITWLKQTGSQEVYLNGKHGGIICCDYNEFKKSVEEVPNLKDIKELFI